jgi:hypothetical protein
MEYTIGFIFGFLFVYVVAKLQYRYNIFNEIPLRSLKPSQSHNHNILFLFSLLNENKRVKKNTQSRVHDSKTNIKVIIMDNQAYWIKDNIFYTADMQMDGNVDKDTTRTVDTMSMNRVQLDKMMFIIDRLREEAFDDRWGAGH